MTGDAPVSPKAFRVTFSGHPHVTLVALDILDATRAAAGFAKVCGERIESLIELDGLGAMSKEAFKEFAKVYDRT